MVERRGHGGARKLRARHHDDGAARSVITMTMNLNAGPGAHASARFRVIMVTPGIVVTLPCHHGHAWHRGHGCTCDPTLPTSQ